MDNLNKFCIFAPKLKNRDDNERRSTEIFEPVSREDDISVFSDDDIKILDTVCSSFGSKTSREISRMSHEEKAWIAHHTNHERIPFSEAFSIKAI